MRFSTVLIPHLSSKTAVTVTCIKWTCREFHREQLSIEHSMRDLDSAVGRLDNILMSVYVFVAILIMAVTLVSRSPGSLPLGPTLLIQYLLHVRTQN